MQNLTSISFRTETEYQSSQGPFSVMDNLKFTTNAPEPASLAPLGAGLIALALRRRRRA